MSVNPKTERYASEMARDFYARTYDAWVGDWPGEIDFYIEHAAAVKARNKAVLELACGTGRVAIPLARQGGEVVGLDHSPTMLEVAREKSAGLAKVQWVLGDMRAFSLDQTFGLILIPGHAFQNLVTAEEQVACLESIHKHLNPGGTFILHLDHQTLSWLGDLTGEKGGVFEPAGEFRHPDTGRSVRASRAWSYEPSTQTAIAETIWEVLGGDGKILERLESGPVRLHCAFRFEIEHLLGRTGFEIEALFGDFFGEDLQDDSEEMIWIARKAR